MRRTEATENSTIKALENKPQLAPTLVFVWNMFSELSGVRQSSGFGVSAITLESMTIYLDLHEIVDVDVRKDVIGLVLRMDAHFVKRVSEKANK